MRLTERRTVAGVFEELALKKRQTKAEVSSATTGVSTSRMPPIANISYNTTVGGVGGGGATRSGHLRRTSDPLPVAQINPPPMLYRHAMQKFSNKRQQTSGPSRAASRALGE